MTIGWLTMSSSATSHVVVRGSVLMMVLNLSLSTSESWLLISKALISFAKLLEPSLHWTFVSSSWAKCIADVVSCLHCFVTHFEPK